jgi:hypothetical protein
MKPNLETSLPAPTEPIRRDTVPRSAPVDAEPAAEIELDQGGCHFPYAMDPSIYSSVVGERSVVPSSDSCI